MREIATVVCIVGILGLYVCDREREVRASKALWIPVVWLFIAGSRPVSMWLGITPASSNDQYLEGSPFDRNVFLILLIVGLIVLIRRGPQAGRLLRENGPILLFLLYGLLSILWSDYPGVGFKRWVKAVGDLSMVLIVLTDLDPAAAVRRLLARTGFLLIPLSVLFIKYYPQLGRELSRGWGTMYSGVTTQKNSLGEICLVFGLASLWRLAQAYGNRGDARRKQRLIAHSAILAMTLWLLWMSNSMTSLSCFLIAGGLMMAMHRPSLTRKPALVHPLVLAMLSVSLFALFFDSGGSLVGTLGRDTTLTGRTDIWKTVLSMAESPFFGTGFESFWLGNRVETARSTMHMQGLNEAHNGYLEVYLNLGWFGVVLLAMIIVTGYRKVVGAFRQNPDTGRLWLAYFVAGVVYNLTEVGFRPTSASWLVFLMAIVAIRHAPETVSLPVHINHEDSVGECEQEIGQALSVPLRQESF